MAQKKKPLSFNLKLDIQSASKFMTDESKQIQQTQQKQLGNVFKFNEQHFNQQDKENNEFDNFHESYIYCDVTMKKCSRDYQEDRAICPIDKIAQYDAFFAVFDGHRTSIIADILQKNLHLYIYQNEHYKTNISKAIKESFQKIDEQIIQYQQDNLLKQGGSTALCCLIQENNFYIINCGDSSCVLIMNDYSAIVLNKLHKPSNVQEYESLMQKGAVIMGKQNRVNGELAVSRSIGDHQYKQFITSEPDINMQAISKNCRICILATDGFWDIINPETEIGEMIKKWDEKQLKENSINNLSDYLVQEAENKTTQFKKDNMTLLAIDLSYFYKQNVEKQFDVQEVKRNTIIQFQNSKNMIKSFSFYENISPRNYSFLNDKKEGSKVLNNKTESNVSVCSMDNILFQNQSIKIITEECRNQANCGNKKMSFDVQQSQIIQKIQEFQFN